MTLKFALEDFFAAFNLNNPNLLVAGNKKTEENHAFSTFFKYYAGTIAQQDIIESRQAMGGLGYSAYSRMNEFMEENDINLTWEGDNKVILQQTSKFILKNI
jgi:acyl-CoA oxidase